MPVDLSLTLRQAVFAPETGQVFILLLTVEHPQIGAEPMRFTSDSVPTIRGGKTYIPFPFDISLPSSREGELPRIALVIDNTDQRIVQAIRGLATPPTVTLTVVLHSNPEQAEIGPLVFKLTDASYDANTVEGQLGFTPILDLPYPSKRYTPADFPGLF